MFNSRNLCPYPPSVCRNPQHIFAPGYGQPEWFRAKWRHGRLPCCDFCHPLMQISKTFREWIRHVDAYSDMHNEFSPEDSEIEQMLALINKIHFYYKRSRTDEPRWNTPEEIFADLNKLAWLVHEYFWNYPLEVPDFWLLGRELGEMAKELRISPHRELYWTMPNVDYRLPKGLGW